MTRFINQFVGKPTPSNIEKLLDDIFLTAAVQRGHCEQSVVLCKHIIKCNETPAGQQQTKLDFQMEQVHLGTERKAQAGF